MFSENLHKVFTYYVIALGLAILVRLAVPVIGVASLPVTMLTPAIATVIMLVFLAPEGGLRQAVASLGLTSAGLKAWPLAIAGPALTFAAGLAFIAVTGMSAIAAPAVSGPVTLFILDIFIGLLISTGFATFEEIGWRGYMLPRMQNFAPIIAMLIVGFLHGVWHLPLLLTTDVYHTSGNPWLVAPMFLVTLTLAGVFYGFLRSWSNSVWPAAIAHGSVNSSWNISNQMLETKTPAVLEYVGGESGIVMIGALFLFSLVALKMMQRSKPGQYTA